MQRKTNINIKLIHNIMKRLKLFLLATLMIISSLTFAQEKKEEKKVDRTPKISGFVQTLYQADFNKDFKLSTNTFRMRRVRMSIEGKLTEDLSYKIQGDFVRSPMLVDAFVKYKICDAFAIQVGQYKLPFTMETAINPVNLEIYDYGEVISKLVGYNDVCGVGALGRDMGIMATGKAFEQEDYHLLEYAVGVFNGNGVNNTDANNRKDVAGRVEFHPWMKEVTLTGSFYLGKYKKDDNTFGDRNRYSGGAQFKNERLVVRSEFVAGDTGVNDTVSNYNTNGLYAVVGYNFFLGKEKKQSLMPVLRYDRFDRDTNIEKGAYNLFTAGVNYWPFKCLNCKLDYTYIKPESGDASHRIVAILSYKF